MMPLRRTTYPHVEPRVAGVMHRAVAEVPPGLPVAEAARLAGRRRLRLLVIRRERRWWGVAPEVLRRAVELGLSEAALLDLAWDLPVVAASASEVTARQLLLRGAAHVATVERGRLVGALAAEGLLLPRHLPAEAGELLARLPEEGRRLLAAVGRLGAEAGMPVAAVGGFVRDLLLGRPRADIDVVVEGDGAALARRLGQTLGGSVTLHPSFLTATVELGDGRRIDVATARRERYLLPGALPQVEPGGLEEDLARRDFTVNALALRLDGEGKGLLLDPHGGRRDLARRSIRVLHPLSFIEDPTRIFRAVRFADRLSFRLAAGTRHLLGRATRLTVYQALSGQRLEAELEAILREARPAAILARLGRLGAFRLLLPAYRFRQATAARLEAAAAVMEQAPLSPETARCLYLLALTEPLRPDGVEAWERRLALPPPPRELLERCRREALSLARALGRAAGSSEAYFQLRAVPEAVGAWALVLARGGPARRHLTEHLARWRWLRPLLSGEDLKALGLAPGPLYRQLLDRLLAAQLEGRITTRAGAEAWAREAVGLAREGRGAQGATDNTYGRRES
ncbi:MAG: CCA tRNA nucleotidyltransferase [Candidatus Rokubacteria bacterium]|nr:CCA tRNA nucleotidyltransferase [Candidatus Rokubacteria bacterium]